MHVHWLNTRRIVLPLLISVVAMTVVSGARPTSAAPARAPSLASIAVTPAEVGAAVGESFTAYGNGLVPYNSRGHGAATAFSRFMWNDRYYAQTDPEHFAGVYAAVSDVLCFSKPAGAKWEFLHTLGTGLYWGARSVQNLTIDHVAELPGFKTSALIIQGHHNSGARSVDSVTAVARVKTTLVAVSLSELGGNGHEILAWAGVLLATMLSRLGIVVHKRASISR